MSIASFTPAALLTVAAFAVPATSHAVSSSQDTPLYPPPTGDLALTVGSVEQPTTMIDVLTSFGNLTNQSFTFDEQVENVLRHTDLNLTRSRTIPQGEVQHWVENLLDQNGFILQPILRGAEPLTAVHHKDTVRQSIRDFATFVDAEDLAWVEHSAATMVSTIVTMPNTDVRQISNSLRSMITDANTQSLLPAGATNSMYLTGPGDWVADMADALATVDASASPVGDGKNGAGVEMLRFELKHANADFAASLVQNLVSSTVQIAGESAMNRAPVLPIQVFADGRTNALLVTVRADLVPRLQDAVALVDVEVEESKDVK